MGKFETSFSLLDEKPIITHITSSVVIYSNCSKSYKELQYFERFVRVRFKESSAKLNHKLIQNCGHL